MPTKLENGMTRAQKKVLKEAAGRLDRAYADALADLSAAGIEPEESMFCKMNPRGHCRAFKSPQRGSRCARPGCGHLFSQHHLPR